MAKLALGPFALGDYLRLEIPISISRNLGPNLPNAFQSKMTTIRNITVIDVALNTFVRISAKKTGRLHFHQLGEIFTHILPDFHADHLKYSFRLLLDLLENAHYFW